MSKAYPVEMLLSNEGPVGGLDAVVLRLQEMVVDAVLMYNALVTLVKSWGVAGLRKLRFKGK